MRKLRLERVKNLRRLGAPKWIVRSEQVALLLLREGLKHAPIGRPASKRQTELYAKFVAPLLK